MDAYRALLAADGIVPGAQPAAQASIDGGAASLLPSGASLTPSALSQAVDQQTRMSAASAAEPPSSSAGGDSANGDVSGPRLYSFGSFEICDACDKPRGRAIRDALKKENEELRAEIARLRAGGAAGTGSQQPAAAAVATGAAGKGGVEHQEAAEDRHVYECDAEVYTYGDPLSGRGAYPRRSILSVLADVESEIKVYNAEHVMWCIQQMGECDPDLGGEETLDKDMAPGVSVRKLAARLPPDQENCGALAQPDPAYPVVRGS
jgi:hypothetical protein